MITSCASFGGTSKIKADVAMTSGEVVYYVGVYYPGRGRVVENGAAGYVLTPLELHLIATQLVGMPVTYEHHGIATACVAMSSIQRTQYAPSEVFRALRKTAETNSLCEPVGTVCDAWRSWCGDWLCSFSVDSALYPRLCTMLECKGLRGLSLSHLHGTLPQALEVSLCAEPARPHSLLCAGPLTSPCQVEKYKAITLRSPTHTAMSTTTPTPSVAMEVAPSMSDALASMTEETRALISAAFNDMSDKLDTTRKQNDTLTSQYAAIEKASAVDKSLLSAQIDTFLSQLDPETKARFNLDNTTCRSGVVDSDDPMTIRRNVDRMLMCCNSVMMQRGRTVHEAGGLASKRTIDAVETDAVAGSQSPDSARFDPATTPSPADSLRAALNQF